MLSGPAYRRAGLLILLGHLAPSYNSQVWILRVWLIRSSRAVIAAIHAARDPLDGLIADTVIGNGEQAVLLEEPQRSFKRIFVSQL